MHGTSLTPADGNPPSSTTTKAEPYAPVQADLDSLRSIILKTRRTSALEYGSGWSTTAIAEALDQLANEDGFINQLTTVDADPHYLDLALRRIPPLEGVDIAGHIASAFRSFWSGPMVSYYDFEPHAIPDFIYLDGPEPAQVIGWPSGGPPISADVLKIEPLLMPLTVLVIDGRALNARFIFANLKRRWQYRYLEDRDQHLFLLDEGFRGLAKHEKLINEVYYAKGPWTIEDL